MLTGTLDDFTLADVLRLVAGARRTGDLVVTRAAGVGTLSFRDGTVSGAAPGYERRAVPESPARAVEDLTFDLMRWERGDFTWTPGTPSSAGTEVSVDVDELLRDVSRRLDELAEIKRLVPSEEAVPAMAPQPPEGAVQINITPAEWRVLVLVDGHRTVADVAAAAGVDDLEAMKLLHGLASTGLVTATPPPERAVARREGPSDMTETTDMSAVSDVSDTPPEEPYAARASAEAEPEPAPVAAPEPAAPAAAAAAAEPDPFLDELAMEPASPFHVVPEAPHEAPAVDRSTAARELAGLFDEVDAAPGFERMTVAAPPGPPGTPRRVEDDDQVTRGLISRLIDGVKGL